MKYCLAQATLDPPKFLWACLQWYKHEEWQELLKKNIKM